MMTDLQSPKVNSTHLAISLESMQHELVATTSELWSVVARASLRGEVSMFMSPWDHTPSASHPLHARFERLSETVEAAFLRAMAPLHNATGDGPCYDEVRLLVNTTADALTALLREIRVMAHAARSGELRVSSSDTVSDLLEHLVNLVDRAFRSTVQVAEALERSHIALN
jgi:hypothetical protein